jgi:hypothetical protein
LVQGGAFVYSKIYAQILYIYLFILQRTSGTNLVEEKNDDHDDNVLLQTAKIQCRIRTTTLSTGVLHGRSQRVTIPDAVKIQF